MASSIRSVARKLALLALVAAVMGLAAPASFAQNADLEEAKSLYDRGQNDAGLAKLQGILASGLDQEQAFDLVGAVDYSFWLDLLVLGGEHEKAAQSMLELATAEEVDRRDDADAIRALVGALSSGDLAERNAARLRLGADHGSFAVPYMLDALSATNSAEYRINLLYSLTEMGSEAVNPLIEALRSDDEKMRADAVMILGNIRDPRARGALLRLREVGNVDTALDDEIAESLTRVGGAGSDARSSLLSLARAYLAESPEAIRNLQRSRPVWGFVDGAPKADVVPLYLYHLLMAEKVCYDALDVAPQDEEVLATLVTALIEQRAALDAAAAGGADTSAADARVRHATNLAAAGGSDVMRDALRATLRDADPDVVISGLEILGETETSGDLSSPSHPVHEALNSPDKRVRYAAATAIAANSAGNLGANSGQVIDTLIQAVGEESIRTVLVIDDHDDARNAMIDAANGQQMFGLGASSGLEGLQRAKSLPGADLFVVRAGLGDLPVDRMLRGPGADFRTKNVPVVLVTDEDNKVSVENGYSTRVAGVVTGPDADVMKSAIGDDDNESRQKALDAAGKAATGLYLIAHAGSTSLDSAAPALTATLDRPDSVRLPAIKALGFIGASDATAGLVSVFTNSDNAAAVRAAAAVALGQISGSTGSLDGDAFTALRDGLSDSDDSVAAAAGRALGMATLTAEQRADVLANQRPGTAGLAGS